MNICRSSRGIQFSEEMGETKGLFFVLLVSLHGTVHAQGVTSCRKPKLDEGYFNSEENVYNEGTTLYYGCNKGRKPVAEGWWGITVCKNSQWTPEPQCIDESDCVAPDNPNAKVRRPSEEGWYKNGRSVYFECDELYVTKRTNAKCENGIWEDLPVCEKRKDLCGEPPQVKNAVITQEYRDTFLDSSSVQYKCQDSYNLNITDPTICISGIWSGIPKCIQVQKPSSAEKTHTGEEAQRPTGRPEPSGSGPFVPGEEAQRPIGRPEPSGSGPFVPVDKCGEKPVVDNGDYISDDTRMALTYKCNLYYKLEGPENVMCHSNGVWSETPVCKEPCTVSPTTFDMLDATTNQYVMDGGNSVFLCKQKGYYGTRYFSHFHCQNGKVTHTPCTPGCRVEIKKYTFLDQTEDIIIDDNKWTPLKCRDLYNWKDTLSAQFYCRNGAVTARSCAHYG